MPSSLLSLLCFGVVWCLVVVADSKYVDKFSKSVGAMWCAAHALVAVVSNAFLCRYYTGNPIYDQTTTKSALANAKAVHDALEAVSSLVSQTAMYKGYHRCLLRHKARSSSSRCVRAVSRVCFFVFRFCSFVLSGTGSAAEKDTNHACVRWTADCAAHEPSLESRAVSRAMDRWIDRSSFAEEATGRTPEATSRTHQQPSKRQKQPAITLPSTWSRAAADIPHLLTGCEATPA